MNQKPSTEWCLFTQHPAKHKKRARPKGSTIKFFRGKPTSTYLAEQKRMEEFKKTIDKWRLEK